MLDERGEPGHEYSEALAEAVIHKTSLAVEHLRGARHVQASTEPGRCPRVRSTGSHAACDCSVPNGPGDAPISATGLPPNTRLMSACGRVSQSMAFLNTPGIELLYSGVTSSRPSAPATRSFNAFTGAGIP